MKPSMKSRGPAPVARRLLPALVAAALSPFWFGLAAQPPQPAAPTGSATADVFRRNADRVVKIQVVETASAAKASIGSGFFVTDRGHIVTNYHVVSELVHAPERYRAEVIDLQGAVHPVAVLGVDVVHDLAVLSADLRPPAHFTLDSLVIAQGNRLYAMGHPADLGLVIVEGT